MAKHSEMDDLRILVPYQPLKLSWHEHVLRKISFFSRFWAIPAFPPIFFVFHCFFIVFHVTFIFVHLDFGLNVFFHFIFHLDLIGTCLFSLFFHVLCLFGFRFQCFSAFTCSSRQPLSLFLSWF